MRSYHSKVDPVVSRPERYLFGGMSLHDLHLDTPSFVSLFLNELREVVPRLMASDVPLDRVRRPLPVGPGSRTRTSVSAASIAFAIATAWGMTFRASADVSTQAMTWRNAGWELATVLGRSIRSSSR